MRAAELRADAVAEELADVWDDARAAEARWLLVGAQRRYQESWQAGTAYPPVMAATDVSRACVSVAGAELHRVPAVRDAILAAGGWELSPVGHAGELLDLARGGGAEVCLVSDVGLTPDSGVLAILQRCGLRDHLTTASLSGRTGSYKPSPGASLAAWTPAGYAGSPGRVVHVGDVHRNDVLGLMRLGARAVPFAGVYDDTTVLDDGHPVVHRLLDVLPHVEVSWSGPL